MGNQRKTWTQDLPSEHKRRMTSGAFPTPSGRRTRFHPPQHVPWSADTHSSHLDIPESLPLSDDRPTITPTITESTTLTRRQSSPPMLSPGLPTKIMPDPAILGTELAQCLTLRTYPSHRSDKMPACLAAITHQRLHQEIHRARPRINHRLSALP